MSDHLVKIIPKDPFCKVSNAALQSAKSFLEKQKRGDSVEMEFNETPIFVDCGSNLEHISCPNCGEMLDFGWWGEAMDKAAESEFTLMEVEMPCCRNIISLNDLNYYFPCGFACCLIQIYNPEQNIEDEIIDVIQNILGSCVCIVEAHI